MILTIDLYNTTKAGGVKQWQPWLRRTTNDVHAGVSKRVINSHSDTPPGYLVFNYGDSVDDTFENII